MLTEYTWVRRGVEICAQSAAGQVVGATARDLDVHALRIVLSITLFVGGVKSDSLVAEDVFARGDGRWDGSDPAIVVANHIIRGPVAGIGDPFVHAGLVDLGPLQAGLVD